tara:strand:+ start:243 stop:791 length:549 start_codon:yes stop_codon:yes gene_type:complete
MNFRFLTLTVAALMFTTGIASAENFKLSSMDIAEGEKLTEEFVYNGFGCEGQNLSPHLLWENPPEGTKSFAINVYDPDAPTGSGWWHWTLVNIPLEVMELPRNAAAANAIPETAIQLKNDYGAVSFGGACPPPNEVHRYHFTVYALGVEKLDISPDASNALAGFMINANSLASDTITATYTR